MALDIWFPENIRNALLAANEASALTAVAVAPYVTDVARLRAFREGYKAALVTLALAFGLPPSIIEGHAGQLAMIEEAGGAEAEEDGDVIHALPDRVWE